jgi:hypothetical protein
MRRFLYRVLCVVVAVPVGSLQATAGMEPMSELPHCRLVGAGDLTWFGMTVYRAALCTLDGEYRPGQPHALEITYRFSFTRDKLARVSLQEIERIFGPQQDRDEVEARLRAVFRDVANGDRITGIHHPGQGAVFYGNDVLLGRIGDAALAEAFFAIWLDPRTREPALRSKLLGRDQ